MRLRAIRRRKARVCRGLQRRENYSVGGAPIRQAVILTPVRGCRKISLSRPIGKDGSPFSASFTTAVTARVARSVAGRGRGARRFLPRGRGRKRPGGPSSGLRKGAIAVARFKHYSRAVFSEATAAIMDVTQQSTGEWQMLAASRVTQCIGRVSPRLLYGTVFLGIVFSVELVVIVMRDE